MADKKGSDIFRVIQSVLAAAFGVQSNRNRERDFTEGKPGHFIIAGILFTVIFIIVLISIVNTVLG
ncbi:MAG: hypothetical protein B0D91_13200 [Oceanospirillales bacterium LUC14_002_19_P2]|nr:MAG: hypothetical protein B0D91_13200 [Oceanospirillales bacterium LUC14_002_19_P2]